MKLSEDALQWLNMCSDFGSKDDKKQSIYETSSDARSGQKK